MDKKDKTARQLKNVFHYSGIGVQMAVIIAAGTYGGLKLDDYLQVKPLFILIGSLGSIALSFYLAFKDLQLFKNNKNE